MENKESTINIIKQKRTVPDSVIEGRKKFNNFKKVIKEALKEEPKTIPQIAAAINMPLHETTYYLMAMQKFGDVVVDSLDDMDEYYFYKLK
jgi:hypothetical protein